MATKKILVVPINPVDGRDLGILKEGLGSVFDREIVVGAELEVPADALNRQRGQYMAEVILTRLMHSVPHNSYERILGVISDDLYVTGLNFVFGLASGQHALFSLSRLRQEFYGLPEKRGIFEKRIITEAVHELGHTYGMGHCSDEECVMFFSNRLSDTDRKGYEFCSLCKTRLPS